MNIHLSEKKSLQFEFKDFFLFHSPVCFTLVTIVWRITGKKFMFPYTVGEDHYFFLSHPYFSIINKSLALLFLPVFFCFIELCSYAVCRFAPKLELIVFYTAIYRDVKENAANCRISSVCYCLLSSSSNICSNQTPIFFNHPFSA